jgi:hypothetical protein
MPDGILLPGMNEPAGTQCGSSPAPTPGLRGDPPDFLVRRWEIWYTYACYLSQDVSSLRNAAEKLLRARFALVAILPDGGLGWQEREQQPLWGTLEEDDSIATITTGIILPKNLAPELGPTILRLAAMRSAARSLFSGHAPLEDQSVSIALPELVVYLSEDHAVPLDVTVRLYESGILILNFRSNLKSTNTSLDTFIDQYVNLAQQPLTAAETDRDLTFVLLDADTGKDRSRLHRPRVLALRRLLRKRLATRSAEAGLHPENNPLHSDRIRLPGGAKSQLSGLALEYASAIAYCLGRPRRGIAYLFLGEPREPRWTGYWSGSPHIHLLEFSGQSSSAAENEHQHENAFKWILARTRPRKDERLRMHLPTNTRAFDDFAVYINESVVLWVYTAKSTGMVSGKGTKDEPFSLPTHHHQVAGELLEYGRILYKSLLDALDQKLDWERIFAIKERQVRFEIGCHDAARFGEIRDMISGGLRARKVDELKAQTAALLALRESIASVTETRRLTGAGMLLAFVLGLIGIPGILDFLNNNIASHIGVLSVLKKDSLARIGILFIATLVILTLFASAALAFGRLWRWIPQSRRVQRD